MATAPTSDEFSSIHGLESRSAGDMGTAPPTTRVTSTPDEDQRNRLMIFGAHVIVYSNDAAADRAFFRTFSGFHR
jgi:hypothetical protein